MSDTEDFGGLSHFLATYFEDPQLIYEFLCGGIEHIATLATGAGHHHDLNSLVNIFSSYCRTLTGFVIGVGVNGHQAQRLVIVGVRHFLILSPH